MSTETTRRLSCAETAKLVRKALKAQFPGQKFTVRSSTYSGGASIDVGWTDGPLTSAVDAVTALYRGASFDGMIDLKSYHDSMLAHPDGTIESVHFGADFIHSQRRVSPARKALYRREVERFLGRKVTDTENITDIHVDGRYGGTGKLVRGRDPHAWGNTIGQLTEQIGLARAWQGTECPGGDGVQSESYCPGCGRWQGAHRAPHLR